MIQDYRCALGQKKAKVFITQNYLFFYDARAAELSIAFRNVTEIKKDQKAMVVRTNKGEEVRLFCCADNHSGTLRSSSSHPS